MRQVVAAPVAEPQSGSGLRQHLDAMGNGPDTRHAPNLIFEIVEGAVQYDAAPVQDRHVGTDALHVAADMARQEHGLTGLRVQVADDAQKLAAGTGVQHGDGFVEHQ